MLSCQLIIEVLFLSGAVVQLEVEGVNAMLVTLGMELTAQVNSYSPFSSQNVFFKYSFS